MSDAPIATLELVEVTAGGARRPIRVEIDRPRPDGCGAWACPIRLHGLDGPTRETYGEDSLQALCLGLRLVRAHLESAIERGARLVESTGDSDVSLEAYFGAAK